MEEDKYTRDTNKIPLNGINYRKKVLGEPKEE
jgi:hypothetical protein